MRNSFHRKEGIHLSGNAKAFLIFVFVMLMAMFSFSSTVQSAFSKDNGYGLDSFEDGSESLESEEPQVPLLKITDSTRNTTKVIVFSGGKGAGHKLLREALKLACHNLEKWKCKPFCELLDPEVFNTLSIDRFTNHRRRIKKLLNSTHAARPGTLFFANLYGKCQRDATYPGSPPQQSSNPLIHPDLYLLAMLAEEVNVDLQIVPITRNIDVLTELFLRREGGIIGCHSDVELCGSNGATKDLRRQKILENGLSNLYAQVSLLDTDFVTCVESSNGYAGVGKLEQKLGLQDFRKIVAALAESEEFKVLERKRIKKLNGLNKFYANTFGLLDKSFHNFCTYEKFVFSDKYGLQPVLEKTAFKGPRVLFFAGLEGTGHHLWEGIVDKLLEDGKIKADCELNRKLFKSIKGCWAGTETGVFCTREPTQFKQDYEAAVEKMRRVAAKNNSNVMVLNCVPRSKCGSIASFPEYTGPFKAIQRPDILLLARMAEEAGLDFRVIILQRSAQNIVYSDTVHRRFNRGEPYLKEERILENNAAALYIQMAAMDKRFFSCFDYEDMQMKYAEKLKQIMKIPDIKEIIPTVFNASLAQSLRVLQKEHKQFIRTLSAYVLAMNDMCFSSLGHEDPITMKAS